MLGGCKELVLLQPKGPVGLDETWLIIISFILMLIVVVPVYIMVFLFTRKYKATNTKATYMPKWTHSAKIEWLIWLVPIAIIIALSYLTWVKTDHLDPYKPIASDKKPIQVEVVSTDWNWLFIYPEEHIAVTNELVFPVNVPVSFRLTSASVMTSFFIPQLGSQMYAMAGMQTKLNLMATETGIYDGHNMEYSGNGYNTMTFKAKAVAEDQYNEWLEKAKNSQHNMDMATYNEFSNPNINYPVTLFADVEPNLFNSILHQFMDWMGDKPMKEMKMKHMEKSEMSDSGQMKTKHREEE
jgi:cytochrome o ubiquinol oxidase subunit 2